MRMLLRPIPWIATAALGLGLANPAGADPDYYLGEGCRPVRVYEPLRTGLYEPVRIRVYEPVPIRIYEPVIVPYYDVRCDPYYSPGYIRYERREYRRRERGVSLDINIHIGNRRRDYDRYDRYDRYGSRYRYRYRR